MRNLCQKIGLIVFLLLICTSAFAADTTHFIRTDCANNGDGTTSSCAASGGAAGAWKTCQQAITGEVAAQPNLTTRGGNLILDAAGATADTQCTLSGFTGMDASHVLRILVASANRHSGVWNTAKYHISDHANGGSIAITNVTYVEIDGVQSEDTGGAGSGNYGGLVAFPGTTPLISLKVTDSILRMTADSPSGSISAVNIWPQAGTMQKLIFVNNIGYALSGLTTATGVTQGVVNLRSADAGTGEVVTVYNNTCYSNITASNCYKFGGNGASATRNWKNNIAQGTATGYATSGSFATDNHATNISKDTTSPDVSFQSKTVIFNSTTNASENLLLGNSDTQARDHGTDLSADSAFSFSTDIVGTTRPINSVWDIGANEAFLAGTSNGVPLLIGAGIL